MEKSFHLVFCVVSLSFYVELGQSECDGKDLSAQL